MSSPTDTPIPAATLIVLREAIGGPPEILLVERARAMAFAGGALVFPGGRIDPGDHALAAAKGDPALAPIFAAIRETIEEAGVAIAFHPAPGEAELVAMRAALAAGAPFASAIGQAAIDPGELVPYARWQPNLSLVRNFDTHFFVTRMPHDVPPPQVDATENVRLFWTSAANILAAADAGQARLIFPTRRVLERLASHASIEAVFADARAWPIRTIVPWTEVRGDGEYLCIPDDLGYPVTAVPMATVQRG